MTLESKQSITRKADLGSAHGPAPAGANESRRMDYRADRRAALAVTPLTLGVAAAVAVAGLGLVLATRTSFFYADDYMNFAQAHQFGLSFAFLKLGVFGEFAPGHRFLDWLMGVHLGLHWAWAMAIFMLFWAIGVAAFALAARELFTSRWLVAITTVLFASAPAFVRVMQWWANGEHEVPSVALTLVALAASLRWLRLRKSFWLVVAAVAYLAALLFYTKPVLLLLYLIPLAYFVPSRLTEPGISWRRLRSDLPLFAVLAVITVLYVIVIRSGGYLPVPKTAGAGAWIHFFALDWFEGVTPWLIGQSSVPNYASVSPEVDAIAQVVFALLVIGSLVRSRAAWRAWAFYVVAWVANSVIVGDGRLGLYGPGIGFDPRYNMELAYLLPVTIGLAYSAPIEHGVSLYSTVGAWLARRRNRIAVGAAAGLIIGGFAVSLGVSYARISSSWPAGQAGSWVARVEASVARLRRRGINPSVIDAPVPYGVDPSTVMLSLLLPLLDDRIVVDDQSGRDPPAIVASDGAVQLAVGKNLVGGAAPAEVGSHVLTPLPGAAAAIRGSAYCASSDHGITMLQFQPAKPVTPNFGVLEIRLAAHRARGVMFVFTDDGHGYTVDPIKTLFIHPQDVILRAELPAARFVRARLDLETGSAVCIRGVAVVDYSVAADGRAGR